MAEASFPGGHSRVSADGERTKTSNLGATKKTLGVDPIGLMGVFMWIGFFFFDSDRLLEGCGRIEL